MSRVRLSDKQAEVFWFIQDCQDKKGWSPTVREIADAIGVGSTSTVYAYLKAREKKGFIEFRPDKTDRRCKRIYILPKGAACNETMRKTIDDSEARIVAGFSPEEKTQFILFLNRAIRNLETCPGKHQQKEEKAND